MEKFDIISKNDLPKFEFKKNYLFTEKDKLYFYERFNNMAFVVNEKFKNKKTRIKENFNQYIKELMKVCENSINKPSMVFVGETPTNQVYESLTLDNIDDINKPNGIFQIDNLSNFDEILVPILYDRSDIQKYLKANDVFFIVEDISKLNLVTLVRHLIVSRSRKIFFILLLNKESFEKDLDHQFLYSNCVIKFICDDTKIDKIQGRFDEILKDFE